MTLEIIHDVETPIFSSSKEISSNATRKEECGNVYLSRQGWRVGGKITIMACSLWISLTVVTM